MSPKTDLLQEESKAFFFEKMKQKTFDSAVAHLSGEVRDSEVKSFLVLFFKKELLSSPPAGATLRAHL